MDSPTSQAPPPPPILSPDHKRQAPISIRGILIILIASALVFFGVRWAAPAMKGFTGYEDALAGASPALLVLGTDLLPRATRQHALDELLNEGNPSQAQVVVHHRGLKLDVHAEEAASLLPTATKRLLETPGRWTHLLLQGQSQLLGVQPYMTSRTKELNDAARLLHQAPRTTPYLYMPWGYLDGDPMNKTLWPDFSDMQNSLRAGALEAANLLSSPSRTVYVAPVGLGFSLVHLDQTSSDPPPPIQLADLFRGAKYPSDTGTFLSAAVVATSVRGKRLAKASTPSFGLSLDQENYLREVANRVVLDGELGQLDFPWRTSSDHTSNLEQACRDAYGSFAPGQRERVGCSANATIVTRQDGHTLWALVNVAAQGNAPAWSGLFRTAVKRPRGWQFAGQLPLPSTPTTGPQYVAWAPDARFDCADDAVEIGSFLRTQRAFQRDTRQLGWSVQYLDVRCTADDPTCNASPALWNLTGTCNVDSPLDDWICGRTPRATTEHLTSWNKVRQQVTNCEPLSEAALNGRK